MIREGIKLSKVENILTKDLGKYNGSDIEEYKAHDGYVALSKVVSMEQKDILDELVEAQLLGRGGAAYPAGRKWSQMARITTSPKFIVCNADEGEPGTFKDRELLRDMPLKIIEGMTIAGRTLHAERGLIYIRGEYRRYQRTFQKAIDNAMASGYLGNDIMGIKGFNFTVTIVSGAGAYVCGENSALLNSIEGKAGRPRIKPPHLAEVGVYSLPTLVNNVESFADLTIIYSHGASYFKSLGIETSGGTKLISVCGHIKNPAVFEVGLGRVTLKDIIYDPELGAGMVDKPLKFYHLGGQSGPVGFPEQLDTLYSHDDLSKAGLSVGSGAVVVMDESVCIVDYCRKVMQFFVMESCGKCTPCRIGTRRALELLTKLCSGSGEKGDVSKLEETIKQVASLSACGLGQAADKALLSCLKHRREEFLAHEDGVCPSGSCCPLKEGDLLV